MKNRLARIREKAGISQSELSRRSKVTQQYISALEQQPEQVPGVDIAAALARALGVAPLQLFPRLPRSEKEPRMEYFARVYPELYGVLNDTDKLRFFVAIATMDEPAFRAMTSILNPSPLKWDKVRENIYVRLKVLVRDADLCGLMDE